MQPLPLRNMMAQPARPENRSDGAIPGAIPAVRGYGSGDGHMYGAVSGTDSESDAEFLNKLKGGRRSTEFRWTPENEQLLEEVLMKHQFDFKGACREFVKLVNTEESENFYTLTMR